jgi:hypothetical protein
LNFTVVPPGPVGYLTAYATGQSRPPTSILIDVQGFIIGNAAIVAAGNSGSIDVYATDQTDLVIDINGYYTSPFSLPLAGTGDIALGTNAGANLVRGTNDIYIGNPGVATEDGVIRIGDLNNQRTTYLPGFSLPLLILELLSKWIQKGISVPCCRQAAIKRIFTTCSMQAVTLCV